MRRASRAATLALCAAMTIGASANAQSFKEAQSFKGKTISILIGPGTAGSGYDLYGRLIARHLGRHLPGEPNVVARNMNGGGGLLLANHLYTTAPRDGTELGVIAEIAPLSEALGANGVRYKSAEFAWIGRATTSINVTMTWKTSRVKTLADALKYPAPIASGPVGGLANQMPALLVAAFGAKFQLVQGYDSTAAMQLAMMRGETEGSFGDLGALKTTHPDWLRDGLVNLIVQYSVERAPDLPDVPAVGELARSEVDKRFLEVALGGGPIGRPLVAPPGTPPDIVAALRAGFDAAMSDPELIEDAARANLPLSPMSGARLQEIVARIASAPATAVARAREVMGPK